jgi:predicted outer membrane repeat protein
VSIWVGGAVQARSFVATDVAFINNVSKPHGGFGGALYSFGDVTLNRVSFIGNNTDAVVGHKGGAIYISNGVAVIRNSTFDNNRSDDGGAIYAAGDSAILVSHSTFRANRATGMGGALYSGGVVDSRYVRYVRNRATIGGAIFVAFPLAGTTDLLRNRFVGNRARVAGGALAFNTHCYSLPKRLLAHALRANRFTSNSGRRTPDLYRADLVASPCF